MPIIKSGLRPRARPLKSGPAPSSMLAIDADLLKQLAQLISETDLAEMEIEKGDLRIRMVRQHATHSALHPSTKAGVASSSDGAASSFAALTPAVAVSV